MEIHSRYRYLLSRTLGSSADRVLVVCMLNPSTADEEMDDPTIRRACRLAENNGFNQLLVLNLLGIRATKPSDIWLHNDPLGIDNWSTWDYILKQLRPDQDCISVAWGKAPAKKCHLLYFINILTEASRRLQDWPNLLMTWVQNLDGSPRHPLYISAKTKLQPYDLDSYINSLLKQANKPN